MLDLENAFIEYVPEHYTHTVSVTLRVKKNEYLKHQKWFDAFLQRVFFELKTIVELQKIEKQKIEKQKGEEMYERAYNEVKKIIDNVDINEDNLFAVINEIRNQIYNHSGQSREKVVGI